MIGAMVQQWVPDKAANLTLRILSAAVLAPLAPGRVSHGGGLDRLPLFAQRLDDGRHDQALHVGPGRVMGAQLVPFARVEGPL